MQPTHEYLTPRYDYVFKQIFGQESSKDILRAFLSDVLRLPDDELAEITILNPFLDKEFPNDKLSILDVLVETKKGTKINVEIQYHLDSMIPRMIYYSCRLFTKQLKEGIGYNELNRVITIAITDFKVTDSEHYHEYYHLKGGYSNDTFSDLIEINLIELPKVPKVRDSALWDWATFLKSESKEDFEKIAGQNENIKKAVDIVRKVSADDREFAYALSREKAIRDHITRISERENAIKNATEQALEDGLEKGLKEGLEEGKLEMARALKASGVDVNIIAESSGLSMEDIDKL